MERNVNGFSMGSSFYVNYVSDPDLSTEVRLILDDVEAAYSATYGSSVVRAINDARAGGSVALSERTADAITRAFLLCEATGGAFDPTVYPLVKAWGFDPPYLYNEEVPPTAAEIAEAMTHCGADLYTLDAEALTIKKSDDSARLDLGGAMKGYAAERLRDALRAAEVTSALSYVGGTIAAVNEDYRIGVTPPRDSKEDYAFSFLLEDGEICATSGDYERYYVYDGVRYHHILNPETGRPATSDVISATVLSRDGMMADAFATAAVVLGSEKALALFEKYNVRAALVTQDLRVIAYNVDVRIKDGSYVLAE